MISLVSKKKNSLFNLEFRSCDNKKVYWRGLNKFSDVNQCINALQKIGPLSRGRRNLSSHEPIRVGLLGARGFV